MVEYTVIIKEKEDNKQYSYSLQLNQDQEDNPGVIFSAEIMTSMQKQLEIKSMAIFTQHQLQQIMNIWIEDIKEGYRNTIITLKLKSILDESLKLLKDNGNQDLPNFVEPDLENIEPLGGVLPPISSIIIN
ncbi:hypothetical protein GM3708_540 [Geminocystis sp. NIES-3708]|uniref:hypothetical protein n=1 Tax=Geminocystis sp. NIES-3708 TaxID=1615909 RepID=UPI0005FC70DA|nr:hypothetical protein [Geminocystis sp. NIES-3708]BAQ60134.1 hypothetical protein GM3708_540 [Geminocystis sp. NIES-3708]